MYLEHEYGGPAYVWRRGKEYGYCCAVDGEALAEDAGLVWRPEALWAGKYGRQTFTAGDDTTDTEVIPAHREEYDYPPGCEYCGALLDVRLTDDGVTYVLENMPPYVWIWYGLVDTPAVSK